MKQKDYLYVLSNGRVAAINKKDGTIVWEVKLKQYLSSKMTLTYGQISAEGDKLFIGATGILVCLSIKDGSLIWKNELKGWGYSFVSMSNANNESAAAAASSAAAGAAGAAAGAAATV